MGFLDRFKKKEEPQNHRRQERKQELFLRVRDLLAREFSIQNKEEIKPESRIKEDLGLDSIDAIQVVMDLEQEFGFEIPDEDSEKIFTVGQIIEYLSTKLI